MAGLKRILSCVCVLASVLLPGTSSQAQQPSLQTSHLLALVQQLHCSNDLPATQELLDQLVRLPHSAAGLPIETGDARSSQLTAATVDLLLSTLVDKAGQFPQLRPSIHSSIKSWHYCPVISPRGAYDVEVHNGIVNRRPANYESPINWTGFHRAALFHQRMKSAVTGISQLHAKSIYSSSTLQCLSEIANTASLATRLSGGPTRLSVAGGQASTTWPGHWPMECTTEAVRYAVDVHAIKHHTIITADSRETVESIADTPTDPVTTVSSERQIEDLKRNDSGQTLPATARWANTDTSPGQTVSAPLAVDVPAVKPAVNPVVNPVVREVYIVEAQVTEIPAVFETAQASVTTLDSPPKQQQTPLTQTAAASSGGTAFQRQYAFTRLSLSQLSSTLYVSSSLSQNTLSTGANFTLKPIADSYWFTRLGIEATPDSPSESFNYRWGIGYDDWHAGTWFVQLNNWGPIRPGDGFALEKSVLEGGYKLQWDAFERLNISSNVSLSTTAADAVQSEHLDSLRDNLTANVTVQWNPRSEWFVRTRFSRLLSGGPVRWSYVFGRYHWRTNQLNIEYANYSQSRAFDPAFKLGSIGISYNLSF